MRSSWVLVAILSVALGATCKRQTSLAAPQAPAAQQESAAGQDPEKEEITIEGRLKPTVEQGGWILETGEEEFLLLRLGRFTREPWFKEGNLLRARGRVDRDVMTTFMQGIPFMVRELEPVPDPGGALGQQRRH